MGWSRQPLPDWQSRYCPDHYKLKHFELWLQQTPAGQSCIVWAGWFSDLGWLFRHFKLKIRTYRWYFFYFRKVTYVSWEVAQFFSKFCERFPPGRLQRSYSPTLYLSELCRLWLCTPVVQVAERQRLWPRDGRHFIIELLLLLSAAAQNSSWNTLL